MDAFEIAQLMANQDAKNPIKMRYGTVKELGANGSLSVVPDGQTTAVPAIKCCHPSVGSRVVMLVNGTEWLAVSVIGGDCQSPVAVDDIWLTFSSDDPHSRWPGTTWEQISGRMLWCADKNAGATGGSTVRRLHAAIGAVNSNPSTLGYVSTTAAWSSSNVAYTVYGSGYDSGAQACNHGTAVYDMGTGSRDIDMRPAYMNVYAWRRTA